MLPSTRTISGDTSRSALPPGTGFGWLLPFRRVADLFSRSPRLRASGAGPVRTRAASGAARVRPDVRGFVAQRGCLRRIGLSGAAKKKFPGPH
jgi:hypothetical protein